MELLSPCSSSSRLKRSYRAVIFCLLMGVSFLLCSLICFKRLTHIVMNKSLKAYNTLCHKQFALYPFHPEQQAHCWSKSGNPHFAFLQKIDPSTNTSPSICKQVKLTTRGDHHPNFEVSIADFKYSFKSTFKNRHIVQ